MGFPTVQEIISNLRSSFFENDFQNAAETLLKREEFMDEKYTKLKKKFRSLSKKNYKQSLEILTLNDEMKRKQTEVDKLKKEISGYTEQIKLLNLEKCRVSKDLALEDDLKKKQSEIDALTKLNEEYKRKDIGYKKRFLAFGDRVSILEKTAEELVGSARDFSVKLESDKPKYGATERTGPDSKDLDDDSEDYDPMTISVSKITRISKPLSETESNKRSKPNTKEIIQIDDDDDDDVPAASQRRKIHEELHNQQLLSQPISSPLLDRFKSNSTSDLDIEKSDDPFKTVIAKIKARRGRWAFENDMLKEFYKDDELCMNAVCALHRHMKFTSSAATADLSRITQLAELLTDGDTYQNLTKKASELHRSDLDDCRKFARRYSSQLFDICRTKYDPYFPPPRI